MMEEVVDESWGPLTSEAIQAQCLATSPRTVWIRHPLFRFLYLGVFVLFSFALLPIWALFYIPVVNRPRRSWSIQRCLRVRWSRRLCGVVARCEVDYLGRDLSKGMDPLKLTHSHPVTIPPAPQFLLRGHPAETLAVLHDSRESWNPHFIHRLKREAAAWARWKAEGEYGFSPVKAFWYTGEKTRPDEGPRLPRPGDPVMLHFHGGGYLCGTAAETDLTSSIPKSLVVHSPVHHILSVDYRLAPKAPWPLPLLDAISSYWYLLQEGIAEKDIIIVGDSAGGHLGLALARWLRDEGRCSTLKGPRGIVLMSPWSDVGFTNAWGEKPFRHNADSDTIDNTFGPFATSLLLRALPAAMMHTSSYLSPASLLIPPAVTGPDSFEHFAPTYIVYGGAERLSSSIKILWSRLELARKSSPPAIPDRLIEGPDCVHDFMIFPWQAKEATVIYQDLDGWLRELLSTDEDEEGPASPEQLASHDWAQITQRQRDSRKVERETLKISRSPVMGPKKHNMMSMVSDMRSEGLSMLDLTPLDLDSDVATEWLTPFTAQFEKGDWDWDGSWYNEEVSDSDLDIHQKP